MISNNPYISLALQKTIDPLRSPLDLLCWILYTFRKDTYLCTPRDNIDVNGALFAIALAVLTNSSIASLTGVAVLNFKAIESAQGEDSTRYS